MNANSEKRIFVWRVVLTLGFFAFLFGFVWAAYDFGKYVFSGGNSAPAQVLTINNGMAVSNPPPNVNSDFNIIPVIPTAQPATNLNTINPNNSGAGQPVSCSDYLGDTFACVQ